MHPKPPLSQGNRLQRAYDRWAQPHYARMDPDTAEQAKHIDRIIYSRSGAMLAAVALAIMIGTVYALTRVDMPWWLAVLLCVLGFVAVPTSVLAAWMQPEPFMRKLLRQWPRVVVMTFLGACVGFAAGLTGLRDNWTWTELMGSLTDAMAILVGAAMLTALVYMGMMWAVAQWRLQHMQRALAQARLEQERDHATHQATEARLRLLQAQIQPHFIFNTLSAVQHWVDTGDPRGPQLLKSLTAFLRGTTESMLLQSVPLSQEVTMVQHYLHVMQGRFGARLSTRVNVDAAVEDSHLPPGLLLTLVENAIEHGVTPKLTPSHVHVTAQRHGKQLTISVADDGAGYAPGSCEGVGLANARARLLQAHGAHASMIITGAPGQGCTVQLSWPLAPNTPV